MTSRSETISRRHVLAGMGAAATLSPSVAVAVSPKADPVPALYDAWRKIADEVRDLLDRLGEAQRAFEKEHGSLYPFILIGGRGFYTEEAITRFYRNHPLRGSKGARAAFDKQMVDFRVAQQRHSDAYEAAGLQALDDAIDEISPRESRAYDALIAAQATTPAGAALKFRAAIFYGSSELEDDITDGDTMTGKGLSTVLRDLESMEGLS